MFLPLAERMVEKMVKEDKIEAEAEVSHLSSTLVLRDFHIAAILCYNIMTCCLIPVWELGPHCWLLCTCKALKATSLGVMNMELLAVL